MATQKAWDKYEAIILLEALLQVKEGKISKKEAIEMVSKKLRTKAIHEGLEIDGVFRNIAGITFQMQSMESAYLGYTIMKPATKLFASIVELKKDSPAEYYRMLKETEGLIEEANFVNDRTTESVISIIDARKDEFATWMLIRGMTEKTAMLYVSACGMAGKIAIDYAISEQEIWEITNPDLLKSILNALMENPVFIEKNAVRHNQFRASLIKYIQFSGDESFSLHRTSPNSERRIAVRRSRTTEFCQEKEMFADWMLEEGMAIRTASSYVSNLNLVGELANNYHLIEEDIWEIIDIERIKLLFNELLENQEFVEKNEVRHNQFRAALVKYIQYRGCKDFNQRGKRNKFANMAQEITTEDKFFRKEMPELYMRLHSMSRVYDNPNGLDIEQIRTMIGIAVEKSELRKILDSLSWVTKVSEDIYSFSKGAKPYVKQIDFDKETFVRILMMNFRNGMQFDSIDLENFRETYEIVEDKKLEFTDQELEICLRNCGVLYKGYLFPAEGIMNESTKEKLLEYIVKHFESGKKVLYYKAIFTDLSDTFAYCFNLTEPKMLKAYLEYVCAREGYFFSEEYLSTEVVGTINHAAEIEEFLLAAGKPLSYDEIYTGLSHISQDVIKYEIRINQNILLNEKERYYHYDLFEFSSEDADWITKFINDEIEDEGYCIWSRVYNRIVKEMPLFIEHNTYLSSLGIRNAVSKKLSGRFEFEGEVICRRGKALNMCAVYTLYGEHHAPFSDLDIYNFAKEVSGVTTPAYLDALAESTVRVSRTLFISKEQICFDIEAIDQALATYLTTGYMLIKDVDSFLVFPNVGYEWNVFLLESYLMYYSKEYALCNNGKSLNNVAGAMVKKGTGFDEFETVVADVLANGYVELNKNKALDYLAELNLLTRRSYTNIETALDKARQIRNKKG